MVRFYRTFLTLSLLLPVLGDILVVQPSFIFPNTNTTVTTNTNTSSDVNGVSGVEMTPDSAEDLKQGSHYMLGVGLCLFAAATCAGSNVLNVKITRSNERVSSVHLLLLTGVFSLLLSLASTVFLPNRLLTGPQSLPLSSALALPVAAVMTLLAFWFVTLAVSITRHPTLVSMLRSTEIILSLVTESVWWGRPPHYLSVLGSLLVTISLTII